jgi:hypothetical protein
MLAVCAASAATSLVRAADAIEAPVDVDEARQTAAANAPSSLRQQPAQSLIGRVEYANTSPSYVPTVSLERSRLLPSSREWPGGSGVDAFGRPYTEMGGLSYRWWLRHGRTDIGVGVGTIGYLVAPISGLAGGPHSLVYAGPHALVYGGPYTLERAAPTITLGWRHQVDDRSTLFADAQGARRSYADDRSDLYSTKVGVEWKEKAASRFGFDKGALGIQFDSGLRMSFRARKGGVGVYLRGQF